MTNYLATVQNVNNLVGLSLGGHGIGNALATEVSTLCKRFYGVPYKNELEHGRGNAFHGYNVYYILRLGVSMLILDISIHVLVTSLSL